MHKSGSLSHWKLYRITLLQKWSSPMTLSLSDLLKPKVIGLYHRRFVIPTGGKNGTHHHCQLVLPTGGDSPSSPPVFQPWWKLPHFHYIIRTCGVWPPVLVRIHMGRATRGGPAHKTMHGLRHWSRPSSQDNATWSMLQDDMLHKARKNSQWSMKSARIWLILYDLWLPVS